LSKIVSISTAVPAFCHSQDKTLDFMQRAFALDETSKRKLRFMYQQSGISRRYTVIPDFSLPAEQWQFFIPGEDLEPFPTLEKRMEWFEQYALPLSVEAIGKCLAAHNDRKITHLVTVSCTGLSAPGLDLQIMEALDLPASTTRLSVNFMGCYAAIHALKLADAFCRADKTANVLIICTELCSLHFQKTRSTDNFTSSLLFADGAAAVLVTGADDVPGASISGFYSQVAANGKNEMAWQLSSTGFRMTLSGYVPGLIGEDFNGFVENALEKNGVTREDVTHWCIHPGGKKILEAVHKSLGFTNGQLGHSYEVLRDYGNMSSPTVLFVLKNIMDSLELNQEAKIFGAAFGPGLTMESFVLSV
jgi:predicted naringenin-chalcone synthase